MQSARFRLGVDERAQLEVFGDVDRVYMGWPKGLVFFLLYRERCDPSCESLP
jgi:hypothetical protein